MGLDVQQDGGWPSGSPASGAVPGFGCCGSRTVAGGTILHGQCSGQGCGAWPGVWCGRFGQYLLYVSGIRENGRLVDGRFLGTCHRNNRPSFRNAFRRGDFETRASGNLRQWNGVDARGHLFRQNRKLSHSSDRADPVFARFTGESQSGDTDIAQPDPNAVTVWAGPDGRSGFQSGPLARATGNGAGGSGGPTASFLCERVAGRNAFNAFKRQGYDAFTRYGAGRIGGQ